MDNSLNLLSRRAGFNTALRHFKATTGFSAEVDDGYNLADLINEALDEEELERYQARAIVNALLVDKFGYVSRSHNMEKTIDDPSEIIEVVDSWGKLNVVMCYYHPQAGLYLINPANESHWEDVALVKDEYLAVLVGPSSGEMEQKTLEKAADDFMKVLYGRKVKDDSAYKGRRKKIEPVTAPEPARPEPVSSPSQSATPPAAPAAPPSGGKRKITPKYGVVVTNELFHNGNVEAWKKIIASYQNKYPGLDVLIWYENERINDINSLFKWGKVKHGTPIMFSVAGEEIRDVRKLQRYLYEGASPRFEAFLKGGIDRVLDLF
jgi:hypothetical protein